jgi:DNA-directed RNA polymerase specialized sigma24 family protein
VKTVPERDVEWSEMSVIDDGSSITKQVVAKIARPDLLPILHACINQLPDPEVRQVIRLRLDEDLSQREIAERMTMAAATVHRRLKAACTRKVDAWLPTGVAVRAF